MIVQCKSCGTKFNFDEAMIEGEGVWGRCSRCQNVFFMKNPLKEEATSPFDEKKAAEAGPSAISSAMRKDVEDKHLDVKKPGPDFFKEIEKDIEDIDKDKGTGFEKAEDEEIHDEEGIAEKKIEKKHGLTLGRQLVYLFIILLIGGIYFLFFTETKGQILFEKLLGTGPKIEEVGPAQVDLIGLRQSLINNLIIGNIRVIEGTAINQSALPMTRIKVKGEITDAYTVVLGVRESYCGNILTNDELVTMTEEQIQRELSNPLGSDVSNDRIGPQGQIPFMIVFTREPPVVVKAFVTPVGAERLLP